MNQAFTSLLDTVAKQKAGFADACVTIGLLLERHRIGRHRPVDASTDEGCWRELLKDEHFEVLLTEEAFRQAVDVLLAYVTSCESPETAAIWALEKSHDHRIVPALIEIAERTAGDPVRAAVAHQALHGGIVCGVASPYRHEALACLRQAAAKGPPAMREEAAEYLQHYAHVQGTAARPAESE